MDSNIKILCIVILSITACVFCGSFFNSKERGFIERLKSSIFCGFGCLSIICQLVAMGIGCAGGNYLTALIGVGIAALISCFFKLILNVTGCLDEPKLKHQESTSKDNMQQ